METAVSIVSIKKAVTDVDVELDTDWTEMERLVEVSNTSDTKLDNPFFVWNTLSWEYYNVISI